MSKKLDISAINFDDMIGEGLDFEPIDSDAEDVDNEVDVEDTDNVDEFEDSEDFDPSEENDDEVDEEDLEDSLDDRVVFEIANTLGYEIDDSYDDSVEGLTDFVRDISQQVAEEQLENLFSQFPEVQKHLDFLMAGGESNKFINAYSPTIDFGAIELDEDDVNTQKALLGQYMQLKGHDNEFIMDMLDTLESKGTLFDRADSAKQKLAEAQEYDRQQLLQSQREQFEESQRETKEFWDGVADLIEEGNDFAGVSIPDREKAKFFEYISSPVGPNGETQRDLDYMESELEMKLAMDYLVYTGFQLNDIIDKKARTKSVQSLRERILSNEERVKSARKAPRSKSFDIDNIDFGALIG
jgi:hypothetical protein